MTDKLKMLTKPNKHIKKLFLDAYPADIAPSIDDQKQCCWIWNTDNHDQEGRHWVTVFKNNKTLYLFDSFGKDPEFYWKPGWCLNGYDFKPVNSHPLQAPVTLVCGACCLYYLYRKCKNSKKKVNFRCKKLLIFNLMLFYKMINISKSKFLHIYKKRCKTNKYINFYKLHRCLFIRKNFHSYPCIFRIFWVVDEHQVIILFTKCIFNNF